MSAPTNREGAREKLLGWETHHFQFPEDLPSQTVKESAMNGFLSDEQYLAILLNPRHYSELITGGGDINEVSTVLPSDRIGNFRLCKDDEVLDVGVVWPHQSERIAKFRGMGLMKVTECYMKDIERWECQLMSRSMGFKIFHYHKTIDTSHKNRVSVLDKLSDMKGKVMHLASGSGKEK